MRIYNNEVAVVMPFHKAYMNEYEYISFANNINVLSKYPIFLLLPEGVNSKPFLDCAPNINIVYFDTCFFDTYKGSNQLWLRRQVYDYFRDYRYILKCELDAFVFKDELMKWCFMGYDYIGAPWINSSIGRSSLLKATHSRNFMFRTIKEILTYKNRKKQHFVGNGGFSLRKVNKFRLISRFASWLIPDIDDADTLEDIVWSVYLASYLPFFRVPSYIEALSFSIETEVRHCYELNGRQLPFGCHAWRKYDPEFWQTFIVQ